jgi:hypothetical protein
MLVVAGVAHLGLLVLAGHISPIRAERPTSVSAMTLVAIEPLNEVEPERPEPLPTNVTPLPTRDTAMQDTARAAQSHGDTAPSPAPMASSGPESLTTDVPAPGAWTLRVTTDGGGSGSPSSALSVLSLDGRNPFMGTRETAAEEERAALATANRAAGEAMRGALHDSDVALGLGSGGPVVNAVETVLRESTAPEESHAVLVAIADESGTVMRIDVESASDDPAFHAVAEELLARLRGKKIRVPAGSHGVAMRIDVASHLSMPSGGGVGLDPKSAGAHFDIADLGAIRRRVIHARVLAEQLL